MGKIWMPGGGGPNLSVVNVTADDVIAPKVIVDSNGKPLVGKMPDRRELDPAIGGISSKYPNVSIRKPDSLDTIQLSDTTVSKEKLLAIMPPTGYYKQNYVGAPLNTVASVTGVTPAKVLAGQEACGVPGTATSDATATAPDIATGKSAYSNGVKIPGSMPVMGSGVASTSRGLNTQGLYYRVPKGYYNESSADPWVYSTRADVASAIGLTGAKMVKGQSCLDIAGTVDRIDTFNVKLVNDVLITKKATSYQDLVGYTMDTNDTMMTIFEDLSGNFYPNYESWHYLVKVDDYHSYSEVRIGRLQAAEFYLENTPYIDNVGSPQNSGLVKFHIYQITAGKLRIKAVCYHPNHKTYYPRVTIFLRCAGTVGVPSLS